MTDQHHAEGCTAPLCGGQCLTPGPVAGAVCRRCKIGPGPLCRKCVDRAILAQGRPAPPRREGDLRQAPPRRRPDWRAL